MSPKRMTVLLTLGLMTAAGCRSTNPTTGLDSVLSSSPLTGPAGRVGPAETTTSSDELPPKPAAALCLTMAEALEREGKDADAILYYERARELDPAQAERAARRLAVLYDRIDMQAKALTEFQELLKKRPKDATLLNDIGYSYYNRGQWAEAEHYLRRAVAIDKSNKRAWMNLGLALAQQNRIPEAIAAFEKVVSPADAQANVAFVLAAQGNQEEALKAYRLALTLEPAHPIARAAVAKLEGRADPSDPGPISGSPAAEGQTSSASIPRDRAR